MATPKEVVDTMSTAVLLNVAQRCRAEAYRLECELLAHNAPDDSADALQLHVLATRFEQLAEVEII